MVKQEKKLEIELKRNPRGDLYLNMLFQKVSEYEYNNPQYEYALRIMLFGVNGEIPNKMREIRGLLVSRLGNNTSIVFANNFMNNLFREDSSPKEIYEGIYGEKESYNGLLRGCSPHFISEETYIKNGTNGIRRLIK